jgi:hypothetical protein
MAAINEQSILRTFHRCFLPSWIIWPSNFRGKDFFEIDQPEKELAMEAMFVNGSG